MLLLYYCSCCDANGSVYDGKVEKVKQISVEHHRAAEALLTTPLDIQKRKIENIP